jgi:hypothetical protein
MSPVKTTEESILGTKMTIGIAMMISGTISMRSSNSNCTVSDISEGVDWGLVDIGDIVSINNLNNKCRDFLVLDKDLVRGFQVLRMGVEITFITRPVWYFPNSLDLWHAHPYTEYFAEVEW